MLRADRKMTVLSAIACNDATTSRQPKPDAEQKSAISTKTLDR
jgi:hypothetical protein